MSRREAIQLRKAEAKDREAYVKNLIDTDVSIANGTRCFFEVETHHIIIIIMFVRVRENGP